MNALNKRGSAAPDLPVYRVVLIRGHKKSRQWVEATSIQDATHRASQRRPGWSVVDVCLWMSGGAPEATERL